MTVSAGVAQPDYRDAKDAGVSRANGLALVLAKGANRRITRTGPGWRYRTVAVAIAGVKAAVVSKALVS